MKPVTLNFTPFTPNRTQGIRMSRELILAEGVAFAIAKGVKRKRSSGPKEPGKSRLKPVVLTKETLKAMGQLDDKTKAMFEELMQ